MQTPRLDRSTFTLAEMASPLSQSWTVLLVRYGEGVVSQFLETWLSTKRVLKIARENAGPITEPFGLVPFRIILEDVETGVGGLTSSHHSPFWHHHSTDLAHIDAASRGDRRIAGMPPV